MGVVPLTVATLCYVWAGLDLWLRQRNPAMAGVFAFYAAANVCLILAAYRHLWAR